LLFQNEKKNDSKEKPPSSFRNKNKRQRKGGSPFLVVLKRKRKTRRGNIPFLIVSEHKRDKEGETPPCCCRTKMKTDEEGKPFLVVS